VVRIKSECSENQSRAWTRTQVSLFELMSRTLTQTEEKKTLTSRKELPLDPSVSVKDLRDCIPAHCWKRDNVTSFGYLAKDIALISITGWLAYNFIDSVPYFAARVALWIAYVFFQVRFCGPNSLRSFSRNDPLIPVEPSWENSVCRRASRSSPVCLRVMKPTPLYLNSLSLVFTRFCHFIRTFQDFRRIGSHVGTNFLSGCGLRSDILFRDAGSLGNRSLGLSS
jgi:hypothetical protein